MINITLDVLELIIEAIYTKERVYILNKVNLLIEKLRVLYRLSYERRYISEKQYVYIAKELDEAGKMTGGWKKHEDTQRAISQDS